MRRVMKEMWRYRWVEIGKSDHILEWQLSDGRKKKSWQLDHFSKYRDPLHDGTDEFWFTLILIVSKKYRGRDMVLYLKPL